VCLILPTENKGLNIQSFELFVYQEGGKEQIWITGTLYTLVSILTMLLGTCTHTASLFHQLCKIVSFKNVFLYIVLFHKVHTC